MLFVNERLNPSEHLFFYCDVTKTFWEAFCSWLFECNVRFLPFTIMDILFEIFNTEDDYIILNHLILTAKFYIYKCRLNIVNPALRSSLYGQGQRYTPSGKKVAARRKKN